MSFNNYMDINRIEFSVTNACTSRCRHCSAGNVLNKSTSGIDRDAAVSAVAELSKLYPIDSVMTFGGEPLLFAETTCAIHRAAAENGIPKRQIITNGYFSKDDAKIAAVAKALKASGVNSLLLSVDAFHREHLPLDKVYLFAKAICGEGISGFKLHPAWVVNSAHDNKYNEETRDCLDYFADLGIPVSGGNNIFPSGNAAVYLSEFYEKKPVDLTMKCGSVPYTAKLDNVETLAVNPNGDVVVCCFVIGNILRESITDIIRRYSPYENPHMAALLNGSIRELIKIAEEAGIVIEITQHYSACGVCRDIMRKFASLQEMNA